MFQFLKYVILQHEDVLGELISNYKSDHAYLETFKSFKDGRYFKENVLFQSNLNALQMCLYHDDFNIVNPLGNKREKYKVSAFYFVICNFSAKFKSRLKDIHVAVLSPASFVSRYGYKTILAPLLDDIKKLETEGIQVIFEGKQHHFFGTVNMLIADDLVAHAIGGYFCNFSTVHRFCRFCNCPENQLEQCLPNKKFSLRTKTGYENNIAALGTNPTYSSLYGLKENSCLNKLSYYHVTSGLTPDLAHDLFEDFAVDLVSSVVIHCVRSRYLTLESFNDIIQTFFYTDAEKSNKP